VFAYPRPWPIPSLLSPPFLHTVATFNLLSNCRIRFQLLALCVKLCQCKWKKLWMVNRTALFRTNPGL